jgi:two-component system, chemotaxis family, protein-glutamate methylesterase/glutaminase
MTPDYAIPVAKMGNALSHILAKPLKKTKIPPDIVKEAEIAERVNIGIGQLSELGKHSIFSCPDCGGGLWEINENGISRYRCHVGHAFTEEGLLTGMKDSTEAALWTALRILEERRNLLLKISAKERSTGSRKLAVSYSKRASELELQIEVLKNKLFKTQRD